MPPQEALREAYVAQQLGCFLHFGMGTFTNEEWATADVDVNTWNPSGLDIDQWLDAIVSAGGKYAVLTAKHHNGFALWPTTAHAADHDPYGIAQTTWYANNGSPDIVGQFVEKCKAKGLRPGLYFSVWDITWEARTGTTMITGTAAYTQFIVDQLTELLTNYADLLIIWIDGWGWNTDFGYYNYLPYLTIYDLVKSIQPNCLILDNAHEHPSNHGDIETWEQNEPGGIPTGNINPSEMNASCRDNGHWFYSSLDSQEYSALRDVAEIQAKIAQANSNHGTYLLDVTPDTTGHLPAAQVTLLGNLGA